MLLQWVTVALVQALDVVAIEALVTDLHPGTQRAHGRKFLDSEPDRLRCGRKAAIAQRLSCPALALAHEQLGGDAVVESHGLAGGRFFVPVEFYYRNRPKGLFEIPASPCRLLAPNGRVEACLRISAPARPLHAHTVLGGLAEFERELIRARTARAGTPKSAARASDVRQSSMRINVRRLWHGARRDA